MQNQDSPAGLAFALSAYLLWGFLPLYMHQLTHVPPLEVVAHRIIWSLPVAGVLALALGRVSDIRAALTNRAMVLMGLVTATLISVNWATYVYAIATGQAVQAALGYYINPLFSIVLGAVLLGERPSPIQQIAIALAFLAVGILTVEAGSLPWVAICLTVSWGFYAFFKKSMPIGPNQGFLLEVILLFPFAVGFLIWMNAQGSNHFTNGTGLDQVLLLGCGVVTAIPLVLYANGAKRLRLSTIGIMQYVAPTMILLTAIFLFKEPVSPVRLGAFGLIWVALVLYSWGMLAQMRRRPQG